MEQIVEFLPIAVLLVALTLVLVGLRALLIKLRRAEMFSLAARYGASLQDVSNNHWCFDVVVQGVTVRIRRIYAPRGETRSIVQTAEIGLPCPMVPFSARASFSSPESPHGCDPGFAEAFTLDTGHPATFHALVPVPAQAELRRLAGLVASGAIVGNGTAVVYQPGLDLVTHLDDVLELMAGVGHRAHAVAYGHQWCA